MSKFLILIVLVALVAFATVGSDWLGKIGNGKKEVPHLEDLRVCRFVSYNAPCEKSASEISQDEPEIYATVQPRNITNSLVNIKWEYVQGGTKSIIAEAKQDLFNDDVVQIKLEKDLATGWLLGKYIVTLSLENGDSIDNEFNIVSE